MTDELGRGGMSDGMIEGFARRRLPGHGIEIDALVGGSGSPLLLLHGYPQTRMIWKQVAPSLAQRFTLVIPDLRGYGRSDKPEGDPEHRLYSKRIMALSISARRCGRSASSGSRSWDTIAAPA